MDKKIIEFKENNTPYSTEFGDIYFSVDDGMAETDHVFLKGNQLPHSWNGYKHIRICETGFGTGLNFFMAASLFEKTKKEGQKLFYTAIEKHPLKQEDISKSLEKWRDHFGDVFDIFLSKYPIRISGFHPIIIKPDIILVLIFDDIKDALPEIADKQDFWFLDGFAPAQNPDMWQDALYQNMSRLSHNQTRFATFTAAGMVKRGLESAGFEIEKVNGFGRKRDMLVGQFKSDQQRPKEKDARDEYKIAGAGLAGLTTGHLFTQLGAHIKIYDKNEHSAQNASSNKIGLISPRIGAERIAAYEYYNAAFALFNRENKEQLNQIGTLFEPDNETKILRFEKFKNNMNWPSECVEYKDKNILFTDAGTASPANLCAHYAQNLDVQFGQEIKEADIWATSYHQDFSAFDIQKIRGQVSYAIAKNHGLKHVHSYGAYVAPIDENHISFGATFTHWDDSEGVTEKDNTYNLEKLKLKHDDIKIEDGWAAFRCASKDRLPIIGPYEGRYINIAHGSHGMISSLAAAFILAYYEGLLPQPFGKTVLEAVSPQRYTKDK
ncbi:MAG: hypothetical protein CMH32_07330 [Micavibrio sp.]|nr:hypothetical protein [Micavibrio sp.]